jgi:hypothetical protein
MQKTLLAVASPTLRRHVFIAEIILRCFSGLGLVTYLHTNTIRFF